MESCALINLYNYTESDVSPRKSEKKLWLTFVNHRKDRSSRSLMFLNICKISQENTCFGACNFIYFFCEISQIFKNIFFTEHLRWLLLEGVCEGTSLVKILHSCHLIYLESSTDVSERCPLGEIMNNRDCRNVYRFSCFL